MSTDRLAYDDADSADVMARDASACRSESHLAKAAATLAVARRTVEQVPGVLLEAPRQVTRAAMSVSDSAVRFAANLFE